METIIVKPKTEVEAKAVLDFLKKGKIKAEVYKEPTQKDILKSIEKGLKEVALHQQGKIKLKEAKHLFDES